MKFLPYCSILLIPITVYMSLFYNGWLVFTPVLFVFGLVPILEFFIAPDTKNLTKKQEKKEKNNSFYTYILYTALPIQYLFLILFFNQIQDPNLKTFEFVGRVLGMGILCGIVGINVGHELGHRQSRKDQLIGELLLLSSLNTHFLPYHNGGHHLHVATPKDAATAKKNEWLFTFWLTSHFKSYFSAWQIEANRLKLNGKKWYHYSNRMVLYTLLNCVLITTIVLFYNINVLGAFLGAAAVGIMLLETVNYIEHYGLLRKTKENGRYERVKPTHSWNSNHQIGKYLLFNLSRHSDHHYNGSKHYQLLKSVPESPQMPTGYPGMMLLALIPPLWFLVMNKKLNPKPLKV